MKRIYVKEEVCIGCHLCEVYCQVEHSQSKDIIKAFKKETPPLPRARVEEKSPIFFSVRCQHCDEPYCVYVCLTGALTRDHETGIVSVDEERCVGCWTCMLACPCGAIHQDIGQGRTVKCDLCPETDIPACVANCPNEALLHVEIPDSQPDIKSKITTAV